jgi:3-dehydroquinate synthase
MQRVTVGLPGRQYDIVIGENVLAQAASHVAPLAPTRIVIVSDEHVAPLYAATLAARLAEVAPVQSLVLPAGESAKRWESVQAVLDALLAAGADRRSVLVALGGGVVGDIAGFAAAVYMRGIRFVQAPTTLLAQVDSSVGGKTGINHSRGKNLIGAFHQPSVVLSDTATLRTLPPRELSAGLAEVLKHGLIADSAYFEATVAQLPALRAGDPVALARAIARSCEIKAGIVARDERETGERALLNFGHTFGHAVEALTGYARWLHGEAVGCGMVLAADLSRRVGLLAPSAVTAVSEAVAAAGLPTRIDGLSAESAVNSMRGDKKAQAGEIRFILLERIGRAVQRAVPDDALRATLTDGGYAS